MTKEFGIGADYPNHHNYGHGGWGAWELPCFVPRGFSILPLDGQGTAVVIAQTPEGPEELIQVFKPAAETFTP